MGLAERVIHQRPNQNGVAIKSLSHLGLDQKDVLVLKSIFNASASFFSNIEFKEQCAPKDCNIILINGSKEGAVSKWKALRARFPKLLAMLLVENTDEQLELKTQLKQASGAVVLTRPLQARNVKQSIDLLTGEGDVTMNSQSGAGTVRSVTDEVPLFKKPNKGALKILVVDDSAPARQFINVKINELMEEAAQVEFAESGERALEIAERQDFDLIFLDVEMPGINGFEVCKKLRERSEKLRIVMLTGKKLSQDYVTGREAGCNHYLTKPPQDADVRTILTLSTLKKKTAI